MILSRLLKKIEVQVGGRFGSRTVQKWSKSLISNLESMYSPEHLYNDDQTWNRIYAVVNYTVKKRLGIPGISDRDLVSILYISVGAWFQISCLFFVNSSWKEGGNVLRLCSGFTTSSNRCTCRSVFSLHFVLTDSRQS